MMLGRSADAVRSQKKNLAKSLQLVNQERCYPSSQVFTGPLVAGSSPYKEYKYCFSIAVNWVTKHNSAVFSFTAIFFG